MTPPQRLPLETHTLYAELVQQLVNAAGDEATAGGGGSFVSKEIRGRRYWYFQTRRDGVQKQTYVGVDSVEVRAFMEESRAVERDREAARSDRARLSAMLAAGGAHAVAGAEREILSTLARTGVFRLGGVLCGSYAFAVLGNMLGVRWEQAVMKTRDVDIAHDTRIAVALQPDAGAKDVKAAFGGADTIYEIPGLDYRKPSTSFEVRGTKLYIDFLTPLVGRHSDKPVLLPSLRMCAHPLRFLDYLIEEPAHAAVVGGPGVLVNVPRPARFAFHKLIVAEERPAADQAKVRKDLLQAGLLLRVLLEDRPGDLILAWEALAERGRGWVQRIKKSLPRLPEDLSSELRALGAAPPR